ncbi:helix-turn-helix domain-containing protein [Paenibacillus taiwanensis]|uniref:helix-turn-helix domain-containing protein n=1 Tax=Paenibacillus taiwanensis TaxID=401638 RepID=UPI000688180B|nr:helix-turn-helix transcriptional regulator [Paenibacillus taiwanensis]
MRMSPETFRTIRVMYGLTQQEYADLLGCSVSLVSKIEKGHRNLTYDIRFKVLDSFPLTKDVLARISTLQMELNEGVSIL